MRVLLAGGGTAGHVFPSLAVADALVRARADAEVVFVGTARGLEARLVPEAGWPLVEVGVLPLRRRLHPSLGKVPVALARAVRDVVALIRDTDVRAAAVFGGYVSLPLALAAAWTRTPYVVHEQNAVPGVANRLAVRRAAAVAVTFPSSAARFPASARVEVTGNPVRPGLAGGDRQALRAQALETFGLDPARRTLLVFGGSQGARRINAAAVAALGCWSDPGALQVLHATGRGAYPETAAAYSRAAGAAGGDDDRVLVRAVDFFDRMDLAYAAADVVLCRAGASSIAELTLLGLPSVLVPYPHATGDHQRRNAEDLAAAGGARVVADADLGGVTAVAAAEPLLLDAELRAATARGALALGRPGAADAVAELVLRAAAGTTGPAGTRQREGVR